MKCLHQTTFQPIDVAERYANSTSLNFRSRRSSLSSLLHVSPLMG